MLWILDVIAETLTTLTENKGKSKRRVIYYQVEGGANTYRRAMGRNVLTIMLLEGSGINNHWRRGSCYSKDRE